MAVEESDIWILRKGRAGQGSADVTHAVPQDSPLGTADRDLASTSALHGSAESLRLGLLPAPPPQYGDATLKELIETPLFVALIEYLKDEEIPERAALGSEPKLITDLWEPPRIVEKKASKMIWIDRKAWYFQRIRRTVKLGGYLLFGLSLGLADSVMQWSFGGAFNCYQFPYYSFIGCLDASHSWEVVFILLIVAAGMIGV